MVEIEHFTCASCGKRIREREDDIALTRGKERYFYHSRVPCSRVAGEEFYRRNLGTTIGEAGDWSLTHRPYMASDPDPRTLIA